MSNFRRKPLVFDEFQQKHEAAKIHISFDLSQAVKRHLLLLQFVDQWPSLKSGLGLKRAVYRYENLWLPLCKAVEVDSACDIVPPLDIHWVMHCHMLNPVAYGRDCYKVYGKLLDSTFCSLSDDRYQEVLECTRQLWRGKYPEEPFELDLNLYEDPTPMLVSEVEQLLETAKKGNVRESIPTNLTDRCKYQVDFAYNVSEIQYQDSSFLGLAESRYRKFLHLMRLARKQFFVVPTYDIDLMWHTHQRFPAAYAKDTLAIFGKVLNHEEESDRTAGKRLSDGFMATCELWRLLYGEAYVRAGTIYRGKEPKEVVMTYAVSKSAEWSEWEENREWGLEQAWKFKACLAVIGLRGLPTLSPSSSLVLTVTPIALTGQDMDLAMPKCQVAAQEASRGTATWHIVCRQPGSSGLRLTLSALKKKSSWQLGSADVEWGDHPESSSPGENKWIQLHASTNEVLKQSSWLTWLTAKQRGSPCLRCDWSITPRERAPYLLRLVPAGPSPLSLRAEDEGGKVCFGVALRNVSRRDADRWQLEMDISNGSGDRSFSARVEVTGASEGRNLSVAVQREGRWRFGFSGDFLEPSSSVSVDHLEDNRKVPLVLVPGRKLQYEVPDSTPADESEFLTVVRFPQGVRKGVSTALLNFKRGVFEASCEEDCSFVLAMASSLSFSWSLAKALSGNLSGGETCPAEAQGWGRVDVVGQTATRKELDLSPWWIRYEKMFSFLTVDCSRLVQSCV